MFKLLEALGGPGTLSRKGSWSPKALLGGGFRDNLNPPSKKIIIFKSVVSISYQGINVKLKRYPKIMER